MMTLTLGIAIAQAPPAPPVGTLDGHGDAVYSVAWTPDGKGIVTAGFDNTVRLWDAATRKEIKAFKGHEGLVLSVAVSPDGKPILSGSLDKTAKAWDMPGGGARRSSCPGTRGRSSGWR